VDGLHARPGDDTLATGVWLKKGSVWSPRLEQLTLPIGLSSSLRSGAFGTPHPAGNGLHTGPPSTTYDSCSLASIIGTRKYRSPSCWPRSSCRMGLSRRTLVSRAAFDARVLKPAGISGGLRDLDPDRGWLRRIVIAAACPPFPYAGFVNLPVWPRRRGALAWYRFACRACPNFVSGLILLAERPHQGWRPGRRRRREWLFARSASSPRSRPSTVPCSIPRFLFHHRAK